MPGLMLSQAAVGRLLTLVPVVFRLLAFFYFDPLLGGQRVPTQVKIGLSFMLAYIILPQVRGGIPADADIWTLGACIAGEILVGALMGYMVKLVFTGIEMAGHLSGLQMGFGMASVLDQSQEAQVSIIGQFYEMLALMIYLAINGHHVLIRALVKSFEVIPVMGLHGLSAGFPEFLIRQSARMLVLMVIIAAPGVVAVFLMNLGIGIMARTFPQMNIFVIGFPVTILAGLAVTASAMPFLGDVFARAFSMGWTAIEGVLSFMN